MSNDPRELTFQKFLPARKAGAAVVFGGGNWDRRAVVEIVCAAKSDISCGCAPAT